LSQSDADEFVTTLGPVVVAFNRLKIPHYVGGSVASSYHGAVRSTMDIDLVCDMQEQQISEFLSQFSQDFYVSEIAVRQAVARRACFNLIDYRTSYKVDVFIMRGRPFDRACMARAQRANLGSGDLSLSVPIATVEDTIISKLEWYRLTDETSDRQWDDVSRLVRLVGSKIDLEYLWSMAQDVGVSNLLERLLGPGPR
jgi:hypothetical protein